MPAACFRLSPPQRSNTHALKPCVTVSPRAMYSLFASSQNSPFRFPKEDKDSLAQVLAHGSKTARHWVSDGPDVVFRSGDMKIIVECKHFRKTVERNVAAYRWGKERITSSLDVLGGEPVFRGTRIPLEHVAALFRKHVPDEEIAEDFPALDERDLAYARLAARLGRPPGRPKKRLQIEREPGARR